MAAISRPLVGVPADTDMHGPHLYHSAGDKYLRAVAEVAQCLPLVIPAMADALDLDALLAQLDGILLTGAVSNVHPPHYGEVPSVAHEPYDLVRDDLTLALIRRCLARGLPLFCICRGFQELNVALGGTLEAELQRGAGRLDHRAPEFDELDRRYGLVHDIELVPGGMLATLLGKTRTRVNSLHRQGLARLADGLVVEAHAPDGIVEAVSVRGATAFALGVQWHPEYRAADNPDSVKLFGAFGEAVRAHRVLCPR
ncbi:MAG: gamma-glutamyl-gamma-aminobutyrate hydrolase family protein [Gammaproteobacteria bacterium]